MATQTRVRFGVDLSVDELLVEVDSVEDLDLESFRPILDRFNRYGAVIVACSPRGEPRRNSLALRRHFGGVVGHDRADADGIVPIDNASPIEGYLGSTHAPHPPHTDGAFSSHPEVILTLQCEVAAVTGGDSLLISGKAAFDHLAREARELLPGLMRHDAVTFERLGRRSVRPIFRWSNGRCTMIHRFDGVTGQDVHPEARAGFDVLNQFIADPANVAMFRLRPGWILIADNLGVLHGRTGFDAADVRRMHRLNFDGRGPIGQRMQIGFELDAPVSRRLGLDVALDTDLRVGERRARSRSLHSASDPSTR